MSIDAHRQQGREAGYLRIEVKYLKIAWDGSTANAANDSDESPGASDQDLFHARRTVAVHVPQAWPHGVVCRNCHGRYPCARAQWSFGVLKARGWELCDLFELLESVGSGEAS